MGEVICRDIMTRDVGTAEFGDELAAVWEMMRQRKLKGVPVVVDRRLAKPPQRAGRLSFKERYARVPSYLGPILRSVHPARPRSIAVFGGRLEYGRMKWYEVVFVMVFLKAPAGDRRSWEAIRAWASGLPATLSLD